MRGHGRSGIVGVVGEEPAALAFADALDERSFVMLGGGEDGAMGAIAGAVGTPLAIVISSALAILSVVLIAWRFTSLRSPKALARRIRAVL